MTQPRDADVIIIGAGVSGLACAHFLRERGLDVLVVEKAGRAGGVVESRREADYLCEAGPNSTLDSKPRLPALVEALGLGNRLATARPEAKKRFILRGGALHPMPMSPPGLLATRLFSAGAKMRIAREPFVAARRDDGDESVADFVRRRFGEEFLQYAIGPFVSGVYAGDPERLSLPSAFPIMADFERRFGGVIRGAIRSRGERRRRRGRRGPSRLVSFDEGMAVLTDTLALGLGERLRCNTAVAGLALGDGATPRWEVRTTGPGGASALTAHAVVAAVPADAAARLVEPFDAPTAGRLAAVPYAPVASVFLGYARDDVRHPLDGFGFLVPVPENRRILGTIFSSTLFSGRAPEGKVALTTFVGGMRQPELAEMDDEAVVEVVRAELGELLGVGGKPELVRVRRWPRAIPQYVLGHGATVAAIQELERAHPGLHFCCNVIGGISVGDCVENAGRVADEVASSLARAGARTDIGRTGP